MEHWSAQGVRSLKGVGPKVAEKLKKLGLETQRDLLFHLPLRYEDRTQVTPIGGLQPGRKQLIEAEVLQVDTRERRIALSVKSMLDSKDKAEMKEYMSTTTVETSSRTTLGDLINQELVRGKTGGGVEQAVGEEELGDGEPGSNGE